VPDHTQPDWQPALAGNVFSNCKRLVNVGEVLNMNSADCTKNPLIGEITTAQHPIAENAPPRLELVNITKRYNALLANDQIS
jgi:hypothetical protein